MQVNQEMRDESFKKIKTLVTYRMLLRHRQPSPECGRYHHCKHGYTKQIKLVQTTVFNKK